MSDPFVAYWKQQQELRHRENQRLAQLARQELRQITQVLRDDYGVRRIILFGSLAKDQFTAESDIDLAVAILRELDYSLLCNWQERYYDI